MLQSTCLERRNDPAVSLFDPPVTVSKDEVLKVSFVFDGNGLRIASQEVVTPRPITWAEFKAAVESQGVTDEMTVDWIDHRGDYDPRVTFYNNSFKISDGEFR